MLSEQVRDTADSLTGIDAMARLHQMAVAAELGRGWRSVAVSSSPVEEPERILIQADLIIAADNA